MSLCWHLQSSVIIPFSLKSKIYIYISDKSWNSLFVCLQNWFQLCSKGCLLSDGEEAEKMKHIHGNRRLQSVSSCWWFLQGDASSPWCPPEHKHPAWTRCIDKQARLRQRAADSNKIQFVCNLTEVEIKVFYIRSPSSKWASWEYTAVLTVPSV